MCHCQFNNVNVYVALRQNLSRVSEGLLSVLVSTARPCQMLMSKSMSIVNVNVNIRLKVNSNVFVNINVNVNIVFKVNVNVNVNLFVLFFVYERSDTSVRWEIIG